jgi:2-oxo-4-hydroxy-4-carboxy-5-ureidoimidazoline decarboxylase
MRTAEGKGVAGFNALPAERARAELLSCCSSPAWADDLLAGRPYPTVDALLDRGDLAVADLSEDELDLALAGHPRIGERHAAPADGRDFSSREQSGVDDADADVRDRLAAGNREYERRFGHVYLVSATGKGADEMLALLDARLANDPLFERRVTRIELAKINRIRLRTLLDGDAVSERSEVTR